MALRFFKDKLTGGGVDLIGTVATGAAAATAIPVTGLKADAHLVSVIMVAAGVPSDVTTDASVSSAGNIKLATTVSTGNKLIVTFAQSA